MKRKLISVVAKICCAVIGCSLCLIFSFFSFFVWEKCPLLLDPPAVLMACVVFRANSMMHYSSCLTCLFARAHSDASFFLFQNEQSANVAQSRRALLTARLWEKHEKTGLTSSGRGINECLTLGAFPWTGVKHDYVFPFSLSKFILSNTIFMES